MFSVIKAAPGEYKRQVSIGMRARISHSTAKKHHGLVQQRSVVGYLRAPQVFQKICESSGMKGFDYRQLREPTLIVSMVCQKMVTLSNTGKTGVTAPPVYPTGDNPGGIRL